MTEQLGIARSVDNPPPVILAFTVDGHAKPKGSKTAAVVHRGDGSMVLRPNGSPMVNMREARGEGHKSWEKAVKAAARAAKQGVAHGGDWSPIDRPVVLELVVYLERPKKHHQGNDKTRPLRAEAPRYASSHQCGDMSKLIRMVEDILTDTGVWRDDCLVIGFGGSTKLWAEKSYALIRVLEAP